MDHKVTTQGKMKRYMIMMDGSAIVWSVDTKEEAMAIAKNNVFHVPIDGLNFIIIDTAGQDEMEIIIHPGIIPNDTK